MQAVVVDVRTDLRTKISGRVVADVSVVRRIDTIHSGRTGVATSRVNPPSLDVAVAVSTNNLVYFVVSPCV